MSRHIPYCVRLSNAVPFCENYAKLYFDAKNLKKKIGKFTLGMLKGQKSKFKCSVAFFVLS